MNSRISVWKKSLGPSLTDIFLKSDLEKHKMIEMGKYGKNQMIGSNTLHGEVSNVLGKKELLYPDFKCRETFVFDMNITCFPSYMHKASVQIKKKIDVCDLIVEIRDARLPFTSTNEFIIETMKKERNKRRIIILNKSDLVPKKIALKAQQLIEETTNTTCLVTSSKYNKNISKIRDICKEIHPKFKSLGIFVMFIGLPNVGKSSIINSFKDITYGIGKYGYKGNKVAFEVNRKKAPTNVHSGTTKIINTYKVSNTPLIYFIDTPGIFIPKMKDKEISLQLSAIGTNLDYKYEDMYVADYILYFLNKNKYYEYVKILGLVSPSNDIRFISNVISTKLNLCHNYKYLDINGGCRFFIDLFRLGILGHVCLDNIPDKTDFVTYFDFKSEEPLFVDESQYPAPFRGLS